MPKASLNLSPPLQLVQAEAAALGVSFPALLTADLVRWRRLAAAATPELSAWEWGLLSHVLAAIEPLRVLHGDDSLPSPLDIAAEIDAWADGGVDDGEIVRAGALRARVLGWSQLAIAGVLIHLRGAAVRDSDVAR